MQLNFDVNPRYIHATLLASFIANARMADRLPVTVIIVLLWCLEFLKCADTKLMFDSIEHIEKAYNSVKS